MRAIRRFVMLAMLVGATAHAACPTAPRALCRVAGKQTFALSQGGTDASDRLQWTWKNGPADGPADFGDPAATTGLSLCVYAGDALVAALEIPAAASCGGTPCWRANGSGFGYADPTGAHAGLRSVRLKATSAATIKIAGKGVALPDPIQPLATPITVQLLRDDAAICFESVFTAAAVSRNDASRLRAGGAVDAATPQPPLRSAGCGTAPGTFTPGVSTAHQLDHDGLSRTYRVYVPSTYDPSTPTPVVFQLHGGFGSGVQIEGSSNLLAVAESEGFVLVSPDGVLSPAGIRSWNGGGCCGYAVSANVDDVGFVGAMIDAVDAALCVDRRRVYAAGMSNGGILSHRLACELADRIRAVAPVAGAMMTTPCAPARPVPVLIIHGTADLHVPYSGGEGCGPAGVSFPALATSLGAWTTRDHCSGASALVPSSGDGMCDRRGTCMGAADVWQCLVPAGGHQWPGGDPPPVDFPGCPFGYQSESFSAPQTIWAFFQAHPPR